MKTPYIYFGTKGYWNTPGVAPTSNVAALATFSIATAGLLTATKDNATDPATLGYRVIHRAGDAVDDTRGTDYTTDFVTGVAFGDATAWDADKNDDDKQVGQVTNLTGVSAFLSGSANGVITVGDNVAAGKAYDTVMAEKLRAVIDAKKIEVASTMVQRSAERAEPEGEIAQDEINN